MKKVFACAAVCVAVFAVAAESLPEVKVGDTALRVEAARCSAMPVNIRWPGHQRELDQTEICSFARFDFNGSAEVCVTPRRAFTNVVVRPVSAKVAVRRDGDLVRFTIPKAGAYSVEFDGRHQNLMLFADPPHDWSDVDRSAANVRYFGPGEHDAGLITLKAGETLFIDDGAVVYGRVFAKDAPGIRICGKGILDSSRVRAVPRAIDPALAEEQRRKGWAITNVKRFDAVRFEFCDDVRIEGITIRDSPLYTIRPICCDNLLVDNVKVIGNWRYNSDGIDMHNCRKVRIRDCFLRTFDDSICVKGFDYVLPESEMMHNGVMHDVFEDVVVERCTIWNDWGRALEIGAETRAREIRNVVFRDCDVIALHEAPLDVQNCDQAYVHDIVYENIRIEYDPDATWTIFSASAKDFDPKNRRTPQVFAAVVIWFIDEYSKPGAENRGQVSDVVFRDIDIFAPTMPPCRIKDFDENHRVERVSFERIRLNGEEVAVEGRCDTHKAKVATSDAEKNQSTEMNAAAYGDVTADGDIKVLFIGNSITLHGVAPQIGWTNRWGMAASSQEKDYVHLVAAGIARETGRKPQLHVKNLYEFEHTFQTYDFSAVDDLVAVKPDYLIIALGENVKDLNTEEDRLAYQAAFGKLLDKFTASGEKPRAVVRGVFWPNEAKDICMENAAKQHGIPFVKANFAGDPSMKAIGLFAHEGVASHPGDRGMAAIANAILKTLFPKQGQNP